MLPSLPKDKPLPDEPLLSPDIAEYWLIKDRRVRKREGILILDGTDHLSRAGFMIALGMRPQMLSEVYSQVSDNEQPIKPWVMGSISKEVIADYKARNAKS